MGPSFILICVTGLTPQVVTETVYALGKGNESTGQNMLPAAIHVLSTTVGKSRIEATLLGETGQLARLCRDYGWDTDAIAFTADHIHVIEDRNGQPLDDIRDAQDNADAADYITEFIRRKANGPERLHVSLAGGRKTMGYFTGHALSLYGRPEDCLSHVLINAPFESHPDFFYPPAKPIWLETPNSGNVSTAEAQVSLASIPFLRLRSSMGADLLEENLPFSESVARTQQLLDPAELRIDLSRHQIWLQNHPVQLSETYFLWLYWLARRVETGAEPLPFDEHAADNLLQAIEVLEGNGPNKLRSSVENARKQLRKDPNDKAYFERTRSKLNSALHQRSDLCHAAASRYEIQPFGKHSQTCYGLNLGPEQILIEGEP